MAYEPRKNPLDFGDHPDHVTLELELGLQLWLGERTTVLRIGGYSVNWHLFNSNNFVSSAALTGMLCTECHCSVKSL